ncbi:MAG: hypothetical protein WC455_12725 [Dehalococcoidia bacterium]|jgi:hypothetical protein
MPFPHAKLTDPAHLVTKATKELFDAVPTASPIALTGTAPSVAFKCRCKVSASGTHTDLVGHVYINAEDLNFTSGVTTKQSTTLLTSIPVVTYSGLDCSILIECLDSGGAPIQAETLTPIDIKFHDEQEYYSQAIGGFVKRPAQCVTDETASCINDVIRYNGTDYPIKAIHPKRDRLGIERRRVLQF